MSTLQLSVRGTKSFVNNDLNSVTLIPDTLPVPSDFIPGALDVLIFGIHVSIVSVLLCFHSLRAICGTEHL